MFGFQDSKDAAIFYRVAPGRWFLEVFDKLRKMKMRVKMADYQRFAICCKLAVVWCCSPQAWCASLACDGGLVNARRSRRRWLVCYLPSFRFLCFYSRVSALFQNRLIVLESTILCANRAHNLLKRGHKRCGQYVVILLEFQL